MRLPILRTTAFSLAAGLMLAAPLAVFAAEDTAAPAAALAGAPASGVSISGTVTGTVMDTTGAVIPGATVTIKNPVSGFLRSRTTGADGSYTFNNVPYNNYHVTVSASGFAPTHKDIDIHSAVPLAQSWNLAIATSTTTVTVQSDAADLIENTPTSATSLDTDFFKKIPMQSASTGLSSVIASSTPGVAKDSNGMFHPQGEHSDTSYSLDGQPITDQQSKLFSNQIDLGAIQSVKIISGIAPAEYGDKASLVVQTTTKSGLGSPRPHGAISGGYGAFGTSTFDASLGLGNDRYGSFTSLDGMNSGRNLDSPEFVPLHDHGNVESLFQRFDWQATSKDSAHVDMSLARSWTQIPNQYDQEALGQDQRQQIKSFNFAPYYTHLFNQYALLSVNTWIRQDQVHYYPSKNLFADTPATLADTRRLTNLGIKAQFSYDRGIQSFKGGIDFEHTPLTEAFAIGITSPTYNAPCVDADGNPIANPSYTQPCGAFGAFNNPNYLPGEAKFDLTRGGQLTHFGGSTDIKQEALYLEDNLRWNHWTAMAGVRADNYTGIVSRSMVQPRLGLSYNIAKTGTVLRAGYGKFFLTPYNENLIVSSQGGGLAGETGAFEEQPLRPAKRNQFTGGIEQAFSRYVAVQANYFWKFTDRDYDFDVLLNTPLAFPIQWHKSKIDGYAVRVNLAPIHGLTADAVLGHTRARFFGPEVGGLIFNNPNTPNSGEPFRIDHDQNFEQTTHLMFQPRNNGPWYGFSWTYESGLVAGNAPFAENATTPVSLTYLTADQQAQVALTCGGVRATLTHPLVSCAPDQLSSPLLRIPAPGTENPDRNPPRIAPRHIFDMSAGWNNLFHTDRYKTNLSVTGTNIADQYSLYNFLSTFSGTHFVSPRTVTGRLTFVF